MPRPVVRRDQVRVGRHEQPSAIDAAVGEAVDLVQQHLRVDHHAVADYRDDARGQHAGRQHVQGVAFLADDDRVAGVVPALVPDHVVHAVAEQVGRLALALVAPLGADQHDGGHCGSLRQARRPARPRTYEAPAQRKRGRGSCVLRLPAKLRVKPLTRTPRRRALHARTCAPTPGSPRLRCPPRPPARAPRRFRVPERIPHDHEVFDPRTKVGQKSSRS